MRLQQLEDGCWEATTTHNEWPATLTSLAVAGGRACLKTSREPITLPQTNQNKGPLGQRMV